MELCVNCVDRTLRIVSLVSMGRFVWTVKLGFT